MEAIRSRRLPDKGLRGGVGCRIHEPLALISAPCGACGPALRTIGGQPEVCSTGKSGSAIEELNRFNCQMYVTENRLLTSDYLDRLESQELASNQQLATIPHQQWCTRYPLEVL